MNSVVKNVKSYISKHERWKLPDKSDNPMKPTYRPELDSTGNF